MSGNEYTLWRMVCDPDASRSYGMSEVSEEQIADMRAISAEIGGWLHWHNDEDEPGLPSVEWGIRFEPLADWQRRYDARIAEWEAIRAKYATQVQS